MDPSPASPAPLARQPVGFHGAVLEFKRRLIEATLAQVGGNRTRAARALGLQRTYLLRLMRDFEIRIPSSAAPLAARPVDGRRDAAGAPAGAVVKERVAPGAGEQAGRGLRR